MKKLKQILKYLQIPIFLVSVYFFIEMYGKEVMSELRNPRFLSVKFVVNTFTFWTCLYIIKAVLTKNIYKKSGFEIPYKELFSLSIMVSFLSYILPMNISTGIKAFYLKNKYKFGILNFGKAELFSFLVIYYCYGAFFIAAYFSQFAEWALIPLTLIFLIMFPLIYNVIKNLWVKKLEEFDTKIFVLATLNNLAYTILLYVIVKTHIISEVSWGGIMIWSAIIQCSQIINFTPGNLGVRELLMASTASFVQISAEGGALISVILRLLSISYLLFFMPYSFISLFLIQDKKISVWFKQFVKSISSNDKK